MEMRENNLENKETNLEFNFSINEEAKRVKNTLRKLSWYKENGYNPNFPKDLDLENLTTEKIEQTISSEFDISIYEQKQYEIEKIWKDINKNFTKNLRSLDLPLQEKYLINLTKYGVGGSYWLPNEIIINYEKIENLSYVISHEIIHLTIENLIKENNIDHWTKERIVDLIYNRFHSEKSNLQTNPDEPEKVKEIFDRYFPDIKKVIIELSNK